jgi:hypothetical protein
MKPILCHGQLSWKVQSSCVQAFVTQLGAQLAPVKFRLGSRTIEPYSVSPWAEEKTEPGLCGMLRALRGDFFCLPFGGNEIPFRGESHPPHGETANSKWSFESLQNDEATATLHLSLRPKVRPGRVDRFFTLREGHTAFYCSDVVSGMSGPMDIGHHAILRFPDQPGAGQISTSRILRAQVFPSQFEDPAQRGYSSLKPGALFKQLDRCPALNGGFADLSRYPARRGFEDLVMLTHRAAKDFAWTAVTFPEERYVWFALKDPRVLASTILWLSNGGRHYAPWNGRHVNVMGIEDVTSYFHYGLAQSVKANPIRPGNIPTVVQLQKKQPLTVRYIMGVAAIPAGFDRVKSIRRAEGAIALTSNSGKTTTASIDWKYLTQF